MTSVEKDNEGKVIAYVDYEIVNEFGLPKNEGDYCYVRHVWIHESINKKQGKKMLQSFVRNEHLKYPSVKWIYFERGKYNDRTRIYSIRRMYGRRRN